MKHEKKISLNWKKYPVGFKLGKKSSSSNSIFQTGELGKSSSDRLGVWLGPFEFLEARDSMIVE
jgi:hypothetical protein